MHRFFHSQYVIQSLQKKIKSKKLEKQHHPKTPYEVSLDNLKLVELGPVIPKFFDTYIALDYFSYENCLKYYRNIKDDTVVEMIKALVYWNREQREIAFLKLTDRLIDRGSYHKNTFIFFLTNDMGDRYKIPHQYACSVAQGKGASMLLRAYLLSKDEKYLELCKATLYSYFINVRDNGLYRTLKNDMEWIEEYPDLEKPSMVLNGHIFAIIALGEYLAHFDDQNLSKLYNSIIKSTITFLPEYIYGKDILYELGSWKLCNVHYFGIMVPLFNHIYKQTNLRIFKEVSDFLNENCDWDIFQFLMSR